MYCCKQTRLFLLEVILLLPVQLVQPQQFLYLVRWDFFLQLLEVRALRAEPQMLLELLYLHGVLYR
jgi:hypothetical protein